jgi:hypothetical protein
MSDDLFLKDRYKCPPNISYEKINCEYWSVNEEECKTFCSLKNVSPQSVNCYVCKERKKLNVTELTVEQKSVNENKPFLKNAISYTKTEGSQFLSGKVSPEIFEKRKALCMECPRRMNPTPNTEQIGWCATCGCSAKNPRAALSNKLWMPNLICPLKKFAQETGEGFNINDAANSVKGAIQSVTSLFKSEENI